MPTPEEIDIAKSKYLDDSLLWISIMSIKLQEELYDKLNTEILLNLQYENGILANNSYNYRLLNKIDAVFDDFKEEKLIKFVTEIGENQINLIGYNTNYFNLLIKDNKKVSAISEKLQFIHDTIGLSRKGKIIDGSYLDSLAKTPELRAEVKEFFTKNLVNKNQSNVLSKNFKSMFSPKEASALEKYFGQYTYDEFYLVDEMINSYIALKLDLRYFIYAGDLIPTSRCFCRKRKGLVFHIDDTKSWKNDPTLPNTPNYNPIIDRGSYNCRHRNRWITEELAKELGYNKEKNNLLNNAKCTGINLRGK